MKGRTSMQWSGSRRGWLIGAALAAIVIAAVGPATAGESSQGARGPCAVEGSWLAEVDIGAVFFVSYSRGDTGTTGAMAIEWIAFDPTLFGSFPGAVRVSPTIGAWRKVTAAEYRYTWIAYGFDASGAPLYSIRTSGTGTFPACDEIDFDYVLEIFPWPLNPLMDNPVTCISGTGLKHRIPVVQATCP
jgi:hypothetical protein